MTVPLTDEQRQRLAVLYDTWSALHVGELDSRDLIRCAHWVFSGHDLSTTGQVIGATSKGFGLDAATWNADPERSTVHTSSNWNVDPT